MKFRVAIIGVVIAIALGVFSASAQTPPMLLHNFVERPLGDHERKVLEVSNGCMAMAEAPEDDWDRLKDLIAHNKNQYADDLGYHLLECREMPDRAAELRAAFGEMLEADPHRFVAGVATHLVPPSELPQLVGTVKSSEQTQKMTILQHRLSRAGTVYEPELKPARDRVMVELQTMLGITPTRAVTTSSGEMAPMGGSHRGPVTAPYGASNPPAPSTTTYQPSPYGSAAAYPPSRSADSVGNASEPSAAYPPSYPATSETAPAAGVPAADEVKSSSGVLNPAEEVSPPPNP
jgi:hypothetical protein